MWEPCKRGPVEREGKENRGKTNVLLVHFLTWLVTLQILKVQGASELSEELIKA